MDDQLKQLIAERKKADTIFREAKELYHKREISQEDYEKASQEKQRCQLAVDKYIGHR